MHILVEKGLNTKEILGNDECFLYHIRRDIHDNLLEEGYIGVSNDPYYRFLSHKRDLKRQNPHLSRALQIYPDINMVLINKGTREEMLNKEYELRPHKKIGWNIECGGGMPPSHSGFKIKPESIAKRELTRKERPDNRNKPFILFNPQGERITGRCVRDYQTDIKTSTTHLYRLMKGEIKNINGWTGRFLNESDYKPRTPIPKPLKQPKQPVRFLPKYLKDPDGVIHEVRVVKHFCQEHKLTHSSVLRVLSGKRQVHKGWTKAF
ncbi:hypothetical protein [Vibrio parahaemolyticus]|uniref:hypothetical protein n=1 Tax=Vibrio parahaemolyticus TaxID=670 RepID=UPI0005F192E3|nr:hypothetical protein [Vibrio parahaemolyticus]KJR15256.1 hypothetical protein UF28_16465 [Vibrio parahaemolyticus]